MDGKIGSEIIILCLIGMLVWAIVEVVQWLRGIPKRVLQEVRTIERQQLRDLKVAAITFPLIDIVVVITFPQVLSGLIPDQVMIVILLGTNIFFLLLIVCRIVAVRLARNRIKELEIGRNGE